MLQVTPHMQILVACAPLDFRKGIDGTAATCRHVLEEEPLNGTAFVFRNRSRTMIRVLVYDGQGFWLMTKRMSQGRFRFWCEAPAEASTSIAPHELVTLLAGGDWQRAPASESWRPLRTAGPVGRAPPRISATE